MIITAAITTALSFGFITETKEVSNMGDNIVISNTTNRVLTVWKGYTPLIKAVLGEEVSTPEAARIAGYLTIAEIILAGHSKE